jgi:hypothetical protein
MRHFSSHIQTLILKLLQSGSLLTIKHMHRFLNADHIYQTTYFTWAKTVITIILGTVEAHRYLLAYPFLLIRFIIHILV